jgi:hypothetical protein
MCGIIFQILSTSDAGLQDLPPDVLQKDRSPVPVLTLPGIVEDIVEQAVKSYLA